MKFRTIETETRVQVTARAGDQRHLDDLTESAIINAITDRNRIESRCFVAVGEYDGSLRYLDIRGNRPRITSSPWNGGD